MSEDDKDKELFTYQKARKRLVKKDEVTKSKPVKR